MHFARAAMILSKIDATALGNGRQRNRKRKPVGFAHHEPQSKPCCKNMAHNICSGCHADLSRASTVSTPFSAVAFDRCCHCKEQRQISLVFVAGKDNCKPAAGKRQIRRDVIASLREDEAMKLSRKKFTQNIKDDLR